MDINNGKPEGRGIPSWLVPVFGYAVSIACLVWVYQGTNWKAQWALIRGTEWYWVLAAVVCDIAVYVVQGWRWNLLLSPVGAIPIVKSVQAIYIGLFANEILPFKPGEVIRCFLQSRWSGVDFPVVLSSVVIERLIDGIWLILGFVVVATTVHVPRIFLMGGLLLATLLVMIAVLMFVAMARKHHQKSGPQSTVQRWLNHLSDGLEKMGDSPSFFYSAALSLVYLLLQIGPIYFLMCGYFDKYNMVGVAAVVLVLLRLGTIAPQAPSNVGSFQALVIVGLRIMGVERQQAAGFATLLFVVVTLPLWVAGFFALIATRMRLDDIRRDARELHQPNPRIIS